MWEPASTPSIGTACLPVRSPTSYDFETEFGAGVGNGNPYTVVFYASINGNQGSAGMINKLATNIDAGWHAGLTQDEGGMNNAWSEQRTNDNNDRPILRLPGAAGDPEPNSLNDIGVTATDLNLYIVYFTGIAFGPPPTAPSSGSTATPTPRLPGSFPSRAEAGKCHSQ